MARDKVVGAAVEAVVAVVVVALCNAMECDNTVGRPKGNGRGTICL